MTSNNIIYKYLKKPNLNLFFSTSKNDLVKSLYHENENLEKNDCGL